MLGLKVFYAMPFSGRGFDELVAIRAEVARQCDAAELILIEQLVGHEEAALFEGHRYEPAFIAAKDFDLIRQADVLIADFSSPSVGRDAEVVAASELFQKKIIAIVPDAGARRHPWIRLYSHYLVEDSAAAFALAGQLGRVCAALAEPAATDARMRELCRTDPATLSCIVPTELNRRWEMLLGERYRDVLYDQLSGTIDSGLEGQDQIARDAIGDSDATPTVVREMGDLELLDQSTRSLNSPVIVRPRTSDDGLFFVQPHRILAWQLSEVVHRARFQGELLQRAFDRLQPGQELVYVSMSLAPEENELVIDALLRSRPRAILKPVENAQSSVSIPLTKWGHLCWSSSLLQTLRVHPDSTRPVGYFVARMTC